MARALEPELADDRHLVLRCAQRSGEAPVDIDPAFVSLHADDERHPVELATLVQLSRLIRNLQLVDDRTPLDDAGFDEFLLIDRQRSQHFVSALRAQARRRRSHVNTAQRAGKLLPLRLGFSRVSPSRRGSSALHDGAMKQPRAARRHDMQTDAMAPGGRSRDGHVVRVPSECGNVIAHPHERRALIEKPVVA